MQFETLTVSLENHIATVRLNRPDKANAMNAAMWQEIRQAFQWVDATPRRAWPFCREGKLFTAGIDLQMMMGLGPADPERLRRPHARSAAPRHPRHAGHAHQPGALPQTRAGSHPWRLRGGGIDLITCADMRYASSDAYFTIKEIDIGMTADVGTLQRLPKLVGEGITRELAYTGRKFDAAEAKEIGLVNRVFESRDALYAGVQEIAATIAAKSPLSIRGTRK